VTQANTRGLGRFTGTAAEMAHLQRAATRERRRPSREAERCNGADGTISEISDWRSARPGEVPKRWTAASVSRTIDGEVTSTDLIRRRSSISSHACAVDGHWPSLRRSQVTGGGSQESTTSSGGGDRKRSLHGFAPAYRSATRVVQCYWGVSIAASVISRPGLRGSRSSRATWRTGDPLGAPPGKTQFCSRRPVGTFRLRGDPLDDASRKCSPSAARSSRFDIDFSRC